jgi:hypothetical protein
MVSRWRSLLNVFTFRLGFVIAYHVLIFAGKYFKEGGVTVESSRSLEFTLGPTLRISLRLSVSRNHCPFPIYVCLASMVSILMASLPLRFQLPSARHTNFLF